MDGDEKMYQRLKKHLYHRSRPSLPRFYAKRFILQTNASNTGLGAVKYPGGGAHYSIREPHA